MSGVGQRRAVGCIRGVRNEVPFQPLVLDTSDVSYAYGPDSVPRSGVTAGTRVEFDWNESGVYPGTSRRFWAHVPARYDPALPANLAVFQDGWLYVDPGGPIRAGTVLDNLVESGEIPPTIGIFVEPGTLAVQTRVKQRNVEYDAFDGRYSELLLNELIPQISSRWTISNDPDRWLVIGGSSGGNCALTAAWLRPDRFGHVISYLSSFAQIPGGNPYPDLIPTTPTKPLKVFMQAGHRDLNWNGPQHNWLAENLRTAASLLEAGYDCRLVLGDGGHNPNHAGVLLPDALRWHWAATQPSAI